MNRIYKSLLLLALATFLFAASLSRADTAPPAPAPQPVIQTPAEHAEAIRQRWYLSGLIVFLLGVGIVYRLKFRRQPA